MATFCTHLTVSRWEATTASSAATAMTSDSSEESAATSAASSSRNNPGHAAQLIPLKAMSNRRHRHRYSPEYHDHSGRHTRQQQQHSDEPFQGPYDQGYREGHNNNYDQQHSASPHFHLQQQHQQQQQPHHHQHSYQQQQDHSYPPAQRPECPSNTKSSDPSRHFPQPINTSRSFVPQQQELPKVPFPNLTLTLALIYVDRLKAKNPEAKGEPGCSHRLFLIAFIIAAKYRCSVALSPSQSQEATHSENSLFYDPPVVPEDDEVEEELSLESRLNSELIFSNHAWVRLLNLGSFARTPTSATGGSGPTGQILPISSVSGQQQQTPASPMMTSVPPSPQASETSTMASNTPVPTTPTQGQTPAQAQPPQSLSSIMQSTPSSSAGGASHSNNGSVGAAGTVLQVEDLDRMEAEFLTFLNFDLATMTHDLETCWNLLVGKKDA
ncbi:hypothetical protein BGW39_007762 [Mortierella sp. 14UC]|nr:hypothetical protein BGW39_007762 [Mortierella sp. 14UC]